MILNKIKSKIQFIDKVLRFKIFENKINRETWLKHDQILTWAEDQTMFKDDELERFISSSEEIIVKEGVKLRDDILKKFRNKYSNNCTNILIHVPLKKDSPGGYSVFSNLVESLKYIGIKTEILYVGENIVDKLNNFRPDIFITSDNEYYISKINWDFLLNFRKNNIILIGLTASIEEYGNSPLIPRLIWAKKNNIDFYYSFRSPEYLNTRIEYKPFFDFGYNILSVEFGANPLVYFPVPCIAKKLDYIFLASSNFDKQNRYFDWLPKIVNNYIGFIDGPGWNKIDKYASNNTHKFLYSRSKIGINLHIDDSIDWPSELNERTYILAACGVPQIVDNAKLILHRFSDEMLFIANTPQEYIELFEFLLKNPHIAEEKALKSLRHVFTNHTTFHRAESFLLQLNKLFKNEIL